MQSPGAAEVFCEKHPDDFISFLLSFHIHRQNLIRPMGVRPDGTLAPLEETLCNPPVQDSGSDSD